MTICNLQGMRHLHTLTRMTEPIELSGVQDKRSIGVTRVAAYGAKTARYAIDADVRCCIPMRLLQSIKS